MKYPNGNTIDRASANLPDSGDPYESPNTSAYPFTTPVGFYDGKLHLKSEYNWPGSVASYQTSNGANGFPLECRLFQNYPNPFNPETKISYQLATSCHAILKVYDLLGREVAVLVDEKKPAGTYEVTWDARNTASGIYIYRLTAGHNVAARSLMLLR